MSVLVSVWTGGAKRQDKMCRWCKPVLDSDWLLSHVVVAPESPGLCCHFVISLTLFCRGSQFLERSKMAEHLHFHDCEGRS